MWGIYHMLYDPCIKTLVSLLTCTATPDTENTCKINKQNLKEIVTSVSNGT